MTTIPPELAAWFQEEILSFLKDKLSQNKEVDGVGLTIVIAYRGSVYAMNVGTLPKEVFKQAINDIANGDYDDAEHISPGLH